MRPLSPSPGDGYAVAWDVRRAGLWRFHRTFPSSSGYSTPQEVRPTHCSIYGGDYQPWGWVRLNQTDDCRIVLDDSVPDDIRASLERTMTMVVELTETRYRLTYRFYIEGGYPEERENIQFSFDFYTSGKQGHGYTMYLTPSRPEHTYTEPVRLGAPPTDIPAVHVRCEEPGCFVRSVRIVSE